MDRIRLKKLAGLLSEGVQKINEAPSEEHFTRVSKFVNAAYNAGKRPTKWDWMGMPAPKPIGIGNDPKKLKSAYGGSQMFWRETNFVKKADAVKLVKAGMPEGYNEFNAEVLAKLPDDAQIQFAREYSPCIYVKGTKPNKSALKADEVSKEPDGMFRVWWD
jgi:hypothetical protein